MKKIVLILTATAWACHSAQAQSQIDFSKQILPILEKTCVSCHGPEKQKGKLRLDSHPDALKGGDTGPAIVPGKAESSEVIRRVTLPPGHDDIMPPKGEPLSKAQTDLLRDWINQGASWPEGVIAKSSEAPKEAIKPAEAKPAEAKPAEAKADEAKADEAKADEVKPVEPKAAEAKPAEAKAAPTTAAVDFVKEIQPILEKRCVECHGAAKQKGKLRLDLKEAAFKKSDHAIIAPGDPEKSELVRRISLPPGNDEIMPNEGEPLTKAQIESIRNWVKQGASWPEGLALKGPSAPAPAKLQAKPQIQSSEAELKALAELEKLGVAARPIAMNVNWREANLRLHPTNVVEQAFPHLKQVATLVELNLGGAPIEDADLAELNSLTNLTHLHLERTAITDAGLEKLKTLTNLVYLNLYGTSVSDAGLEHLKSLSQLRKLYLWQTKATTNGVATLKQTIPDLEANLGLDLAAAAAPKTEPAKEEKK